MPFYKKFSPLVFAFFVVTLSLFAFTVNDTSAVKAQQPECRDAAGGLIPCTPTPAPPVGAAPTITPAAGPDSDGDGFVDSDDRCPRESGLGVGRGDCPDPDGDNITNDGDVCPLQPGPATTGGCPVVTPTPGVVTPGAANATAVPGGSTGQANPLLPPADGACQLTTASTTPSNVRAEPTAQAQVVGILQSNELYAVLATVVNGDGVWYRVETGWVSGVAVNIGGKCAARIVTTGPAGFSIAQDKYDQTKAGGIVPEEKCQVVFNGIRLCKTVLTAYPNDPADPQAYGINVCGFGPQGVKCTLTSFVDPLMPDCPPEFCGPPPGELPQPEPPPKPPKEKNGQEADLCKNKLGDLAAAPGTNGTDPSFSKFNPNGLVFGIRLPPVDPDPCILNLYVVREDQAANGRIPVDMLDIVIDLPSGDPTHGLDLAVFEFGGDEPGKPYFRRYDSVQYDLSGNVCIPVTHGNFINCPGNPPTAPTDRTVAPTPTRDPVLDVLLSLPPATDPTEKFGCTVKDNILACSCNNSTDCVQLAIACKDADVPITCYGDVCGCGSNLGGD